MIERPLGSAFAALFALVALSTFAVADVKEDWEVLKKHDAPVPNRVRAAKVIAERAKQENECGKVAADFIDIALKATTPPELRSALSSALSTCGGEDTGKALAKHVGQGQPAERAWVVRAARGLTSVEIDKALVSRGLADEDADVRHVALDVIVQHKYTAAIPALEAILKANKDAELLGPAIAAISSLQDGAPGWSDWLTKLADYAKSKNDGIRRSALSVLAQEKNIAQLDLFLDALTNSDWSTRAIALGYLRTSGSKKAVGAIIEEMRREPLGTRMNAECEHALAKISGMNFGDRVEDWATWWKNNEPTFEFPKSSGYARTGGPRPARLDTGTGVAKFYGIEVESKRVVFVIDISGSMTEATKDALAPGTPRVDVAKRELTKIIDELPLGSMFNVITFNDVVTSWRDHIGDLPSGVSTGARRGERSPSTGDARKEEKPKDSVEQKRDDEKQKRIDDLLRAKAKDFVNRQGASSGTNIYDAFARAFEDPNVDTIFFLTDGIPSTGEETDPQLIREAVARWNLTRKLKINTIAIGVNFDYLRGISADSGGEYRFLQ